MLNNAEEYIPFHNLEIMFVFFHKNIDLINLDRAYDNSELPFELKQLIALHNALPSTY